MHTQIGPKVGAKEQEVDVTRNKLRAKAIESFSKGKYGDGAGLYLKKANRYRGKWAFIY
jgi:hypothetical protein